MSKQNLVFPVTIVTACRAKFKKSYITQFGLELSCSCAQDEASDVSFFGKLTSFIDLKYSEIYQ